MTRPTLVFGELLHDLDTKRGRIASYTLYSLNVVFLGLYIIGTFEISQQYRTILLGTELCLAIIFLFEYVSRLDYADDTRKEVLSFYSIADLLAILPALLVVFLPFLGQLAVFRSLQVLRVFRFVRIGLENNRLFNYKLTGKQVVVAEALTAIFIIFTVHAGVVYAFEAGINPEFQNFGDAFYYSIVALTTTGFGTRTPITAGGTIVTGIGLILAITLIPWIVVRARKGTGNTTCDRCGTDRHFEEANYCHKCGEKLS